MKIKLLSETKVGKGAAVLTLLFIVLMVLKLLNLGIPLPTPLIAVFGFIGFIMGIVSFFKNKDRSVLTVLSMLVGMLIVFWTVAEIAFPH